MDPLSITGSCVAVACAGEAVVKVLKNIRDLTRVPDILLSIINEVADLTSIVHVFRSSFQAHEASSNVSQTSISLINQLLDRTQATLLELDQVINHRVLQPPKPNEKVTFGRTAWLAEQRHVQRLQKALRISKLDIMIQLSALNSYAAPLFHVIRD